MGFDEVSDARPWRAAVFTLGTDLDQLLVEGVHVLLQLPLLLLHVLQVLRQRLDLCLVLQARGGGRGGGGGGADGPPFVDRT